MVHWPKISPMEMATGPPPKGKEHRRPEKYFAHVMTGAQAIEGQCSKSVRLSDCIKCVPNGPYALLCVCLTCLCCHDLILAHVWPYVHSKRYQSLASPPSDCHEGCFISTLLPLANVLVPGDSSAGAKPGNQTIRFYCFHLALGA